MNTHHVYGHYSRRGELLYVGLTGDLVGRTRAHGAHSPWWPQVARVTSLAEFAARRSARSYESMLIVSLAPPNNRKGVVDTDDARFEAEWAAFLPKIEKGLAQRRSRLLAEAIRTDPISYTVVGASTLRLTTRLVSA